MRKLLTELVFVTFMLLMGSAVWLLMHLTTVTPQTVEVYVAPVVFERLEETPLPKSRFYRSVDRIHVSKREFDCLARNIYYEAVGEDYIGKIAVAQVTWNRVKSGRWGHTICVVVHAPYQFSWTRQKKLYPSGDGWIESQQAARDFLNGTRVSGLQNSKYYHATWIRDPDWTNRLEVAMVIGQHKFYNRPE